MMLSGFIAGSNEGDARRREPQHLDPQGTNGLLSVCLMDVVEGSDMTGKELSCQVPGWGAGGGWGEGGGSRGGVTEE